MAMRITTKMMQSNSLSNLNTNKTLQEKLTNQLSTMKKITRPSDDPVIAIRSLKLNSTLNKIDQYYEKNSEDAESWLSLTESAISTTNTILESISSLITQLAQGSQTADEREAILQNLSNYQTEIYSTGNATSAGRSIFTGYRTDTTLTLLEDKEERNTITEQWDNTCIDTITHVVAGDMANINAGNFNTPSYSAYTEYKVTSYDVARIRLAYDNLDENSNNNVSLSYIVDGKETTLDITKSYTTATDEAYKEASENSDAIIYIAETGELLLGSDVQKELAALSIDDEIRITYDKSQWKTDDLDPVHYFYTKRYDETHETDPLIYNEEKLTKPKGNVAKQIIEYDIGSNQSIRVNTTADEVFTHDMGRDVGEVYDLLEEYDSLSDTYDTVKGLIDSGKYEGNDLETLNKQLDALDKACTLAKANLQDRCEGLQTIFKGYVNQATLARTDVGSRESRLTLIQNRLSAQQTNFEELVSDNEDADVTELAIELSSVQLTYEAALSSISYVMKTTLLDFI